jgi:ribonuclease inhibitor
VPDLLRSIQHAIIAEIRIRSLLFRRYNNMQTIVIDGSRYESPRDLHLALKRMLSLPDYYGMNADALNDCLSERVSPVNVWILDPGAGEVASAINILRTVFADNGGEVKEL